MANTAGCLGKIGYPTRAEADTVKRALRAKPKYIRIGPDRPAALSTYHCAKCGHFHLGRERRGGIRATRKTADHEAGSFKTRQARYAELTK